jgi:hypothetical protein
MNDIKKDRKKKGRKKKGRNKKAEKLEDVLYRLYIVELCSIGVYRYLIVFVVTVHCLRQSA